MADTPGKYGGLPTTPEGEVDKARAKALYDASLHVEWTPFCAAVSWDPVGSRARLPIARWVKEKRYRLAKQQAEELKDILQQNKPLIAQDIVKTLRDYPYEHDEFLKLLKAARIALSNEMAVHMRKTQLALNLKKDPDPLRKGMVHEIQALAISLSAITQSKHRSLLLGDMTIRGIEVQTEEDISRLPESAKHEQKVGIDDFTVMGWEAITPAQLDDFFGRYFDKPQPRIADPVAAETGAPALPAPSEPGSGDGAENT